MTNSKFFHKPAVCPTSQQTLTWLTYHGTTQTLHSGCTLKPAQKGGKIRWASSVWRFFSPSQDGPAVCLSCYCGSNNVAWELLGGFFAGPNLTTSLWVSDSQNLTKVITLEKLLPKFVSKNVDEVASTPQSDSNTQTANFWRDDGINIQPWGTVETPFFPVTWRVGAG